EDRRKAGTLPLCDSVDSLLDVIAEHPLLHPPHREQIVGRRKQPVPHSIIALAGETRIVAHLDLRDGVAFYFEECRQEPMHALEELEVVDALALELSGGTC